MNTKNADRRRKKGAVRTVMLIACAVALAGLIFYNNRETRPSQTEQSAQPADVPDTVPAATDAAPQPQAPVAAPAPAGGETGLTDPPPSPPSGLPRTSHALPLRRSVTVDAIECRALDRQDIRIVMGIRLFFENDDMREEILLKREQIKLLTRKTVARKNLDDIVVGPLQAELLAVLDPVFKAGRLAGIECLDFRIEKVQ